VDANKTQNHTTRASPEWETVNHTESTIVLHLSSSYNAMACTITALGALRICIRDLGDFPMGPHEPTELYFSSEDPSLCIGAAVAPRAVLASDVELRSIPRSARPGAPLRLDLVIRDAFGALLPREQHIAKTSIIKHVAVEASFKEMTQGRPAFPLAFYVSDTDPTSRGVTIAIMAPGDPLPSRGRLGDIIVDRITVAGELVDGPPFCVSVVRGLPAPARLRGVQTTAFTAPCISTDLGLVVPTDQNRALTFSSSCVAEEGEARVFDFSAAGMSRCGFSCAIDDKTHTLILCEYMDSEARVIAVDTKSRRVRWQTPAGDMRGSYGVAALSARGVVIASAFHKKELHVYAISDGRLLATVFTDNGVFDLTCDPNGSVVYTAADNEPVSLWEWDGRTLSRRGQLAEVDGIAIHSRKPLAFVPSQGESPAYLIVGQRNTNTLFVFTAPSPHAEDHKLVFSYTLDGAEGKVGGIAADPTGCALAVTDCCGSGTICVLPWPLPGMPPLEPLL
jgi:hypothetical protein